MDACGSRGPCAADTQPSRAVDNTVDPDPAAPLRLLDLPTDLLLQALHMASFSSRLVCSTFRNLLDGGRTQLSLRPRPARPARCRRRRLQDLTALLRRVPSLTALRVDSFQFDTLRFLEACPVLESLTLAEAPHLNHQALALLVACPQLTHLDLSGVTALSSIQPLSALTALQSLDLGTCDTLDSIAPVAHCPLLTSLVLGRGASVLGPLAALRSLASLVCRSGEPVDLAPLTSCAASLTRLVCTEAGPKDLSPLSRHTRLAWLEVGSALGSMTPLDLGSLRPLALFAGTLTHLALKNCRLDTLLLLSISTSLTSLHLRNVRGTGDLSPLSSCTALATLDLSRCIVTTLAPLSSLHRFLTSLDLNGCVGVADISPLASCTALTFLDVSATGLTLVSPLAACTLLRTLRVARCKLAPGQADLLRQQIPGLRVDAGI